MNEFELSKNPQLTEYVAKDLNVEAKLPYDDDSFDGASKLLSFPNQLCLHPLTPPSNLLFLCCLVSVVTCVVSVDYLNKPRAVFEEINRVLKPGGEAVISCSNRCFPSKAIQLWLQTNDLEHVFIVGSFFHYAGGFEPPSAVDISPNPGRSDPLFIIRGKKATVL